MKHTKQSLLEKICSVISDSGTPQESLQTIVELLVQQFGMDVCSVYLLDDQRRRLILRATIGLAKESVDRISMGIDEGLTGLTLETALLLPLAFAYWLYLVQQGQSHFDVSNSHPTLLLMLSGIVTAMPLLFFAAATKRLSLSAVGFMMYINPTMQFVVAVYVLQEALNVDQLIGFCFIWCALLVFSLGSLKMEKASATY